MALWYWMGENLTGHAFGVLGLSGFIYLLSSTLSKPGWVWIPIAVATLAFGVICHIGALVRQYSTRNGQGF